MGEKDIKGMMDNFLYIKSKGTPVRDFKTLRGALQRPNNIAM